MSTTLDASTGVQDMDSTLVAVRVLSPKALFNRMKIRVLEALRTIRSRAAARKAAIAQFVKPYWEKIPSGLPGLALLGSVTHPPIYRWFLRRTSEVALGLSAIAFGGLHWTGRGVRWLARASARALTWAWPTAGARYSAFVEKAAANTSAFMLKAESVISDAGMQVFGAASSDKAVRTAHQLGLPLVIAAGINLVSQGLLAATVSAIPLIGLPLAAAMTTTKGMGLAAGAIAATSTFIGWGEYQQAAQAPTEPATEVKVVEEPKANVETREVLVNDQTVVIEVKGDLSPEEAQEIAMQHVAKTEADEAEELKALEAEVAKGNSVAKQHGPAPKGRARKQQASRQAAPAGAR